MLLTYLKVPSTHSKNSKIVIDRQMSTPAHYRNKGDTSGKDAQSPGRLSVTPVYATSIEEGGGHVRLLSVAHLAVSQRRCQRARVRQTAHEAGVPES